MASDRRGRTPFSRSVFAAAFAGTALAWYDDHIFGVATALVFGELFFPRFDATAAALASFVTYAVGFVARPVAAAVVGHFGDRAGRRPMLILTLLLTGGSTFLIGALPGYAAIGVAAPLLLVLLRVVQGFGVAGEWGGAVLIAVEHAPPTRRSLWGAFAQYGVPIGVLTSNLAFLAVAALPDDVFTAYGWRLPFLFSAVLVVLGLLVRLRLPESPHFAAVRRAGATAAAPLRELTARHRHDLLWGALAATAPPALGYLLTVHLLGHGTREAGFQRGTLLTLVLLATVVWAAAILGAARLADRIGPRRVYLIGAAVAVIWPVPMFALVDTGEVGPALAACTVAAVVLGMMTGAQGALFADLFGVRVRYSGVSIAYTAGGVLGGAVTPLAASALFLASGSGAVVAGFVAALCLASVVGAARLRGAGAAAGRPGRSWPIRTLLRRTG